MFAIGTGVNVIVREKVAVQLPLKLWNTNSNIREIDINFGNNTGYKSIKNGIIAETTYKNNGDYIWTYRIKLTDNKYLYARQKVKVEKAILNQQINISESKSSKNFDNTNCSTNVLKKILAKRNYLGKKGSATLQIVYGETCGIIKKPLIVVEGLDTGLKAESGSIGDTDIDSFLKSIRSSRSFNLQRLTTLNTLESYDIIYVNWDNGTDYLQRNAYVLESVIEWVNEQKIKSGSTKENVVLGQSMGGVISRYALRDMENINLKHDTNLYVSHDAPHQGAHLPPGIQYFARHTIKQILKTPFSNLEFDTAFGEASVDDLIDLMNSPAVKQMTIDYVNNNLNIQKTDFNNWQKELKAKGYPQKTRNISLSNASHCAELQNISTNSSLIKIQGNIKTAWLGDIINNFLGNIFASAFTLTTQEPGFLLNFLPGSVKLDVLIDARTYPKSGSNRLYKGKISFTKKLLWLVPIKITITNIEKSSGKGNLPIDTFPGGILPDAEFDTTNTNENNIFITSDFTITNNTSFCFIPAVSALDVGRGNTILNTNDYLKNYNSINRPTGSKAIPFDNFTTTFNRTGLNEGHLTFNFSNANWLASELDNISSFDEFDCSYFCNNNQIIGDKLVCDNSTFSFIPNNSINSYSWSIKENTNRVSLLNTTKPKITLINKYPNSTGKFVTINLRINGICGSRNFSKRVWVGKPSIHVSKIDEVCTSTDSYLEFKVTVQGAFNNNFNFSYDPKILTTSILSDQTFDKLKLVIPKTKNLENIGVTFSISNKCGKSSTYMNNVNGNCNKPPAITPIDVPTRPILDPTEQLKPKILTNNTNSVFTIFPNPTKEILNVSIPDNVFSKNANSSVITIIDINGKTIYKSKIRTRIYKIDISKYQSGMYLIKYETDENFIISKIIIE